MRTSRFYLPLAISVISAMLLGCPRPPKPTPAPNGGQPTQLGRLMFDTPRPFTDVGTIDTSRIAEVRGGTTHLVYILSDGGSQRIMYSRVENGEFVPPSYLSQDEGSKQGGGFLTARSESDVVAYWVNVPASGGQLMYKETSNGGDSFTLEKQWNNRSEVRWPCALAIGTDLAAYFFVHGRDGWELAANRNFSIESEPTVDTVQGTPFHLQGVTDGVSKVWLAYFARVENADGGRIAFLTSEDGGVSFTRQYLFDDKVIASVWSFFDIARGVDGRNNVVHLIFTEETPELTAMYYSRSENGGEFTEPISVLTSEEPLTRAPLLVANGKYALIVTADAEDNGPALRYLLSEDAGKSFAPPAIATRSVANPETIAGAIDTDGRVILVWDDLASQSAPGEQLYRLKGTIRGQ